MAVSADINLPSVDYEFTSIDYAVEFALLNQDAEWIKLNGEMMSLP